MLPVALTAIRARLAPLVLVAAMSVGVLPSAVAEESQTRSGLAGLEVEGSSACTTRAELVARVRARASNASLDVGAAVAVSVRFSAARAGAIVAEVTFTSADAKPSARRIQAGSCSEATDAVALIIAMTLSPARSRGDGSGDAAASTSTGPDQNTSSSTAPPTAAERPRTVAERVEPESRAVNPSSPRSANVGSFGVQLAAQSFLGPAPQVMPGVAVYAVAGLERGTAWSPAILLGVTHAWQSSTQEQGGRASFTLDAVTFDACPIRLRLGGIETRPCGSVLVGRFSARGTDTINQAPASLRPFWVVGGAVVASTNLFWLLEASARIAVGANAVRDSFEFTPSVFHTVPAITVAASAGVGMRWR